MFLNVVASLLSRPHASHGGGDGALGALLGGAVFLVFLVVFAVVWIVFGFIMSKLFQKAGKPGLAGYIPIWQQIVELEMIGKPAWWVILYFIPGVNFFIQLYVHAMLCERFGVESPLSWIAAFFTPVLLVFLIIGAFGDATYRPPTATSALPAY
jgi:hypothetical protein